MVRRGKLRCVKTWIVWRQGEKQDTVQLSQSSCYLKSQAISTKRLPLNTFLSLSLTAGFKSSLTLFLIGEKTCIICQLNQHGQTFTSTWILLGKCDWNLTLLVQLKGNLVHIRSFSDVNKQSHMQLKWACLSLPVTPNLLASKPSLSDLYLWLLSSLELVNCLSLFLLFMLQ